MRIVILMALGGLALSGCKAAADDDMSPPASEVASDTTAEDWHFRYDETRAEVTARRGEAVLVYPLREMGSQGDELRLLFRGYDGVSWTIPPASADAEGQEEDALINVPYPPGVSTPPIHGPGGGQSGYTGHGRPPGIDRATWGRMCLFASIWAATLTCAAATTSCVAGSFITIGGLAIPCTLMTALACASTTGAISLAALDCPSTARGK